MLRLAAALQREEGAEGTRLISLGATHASAKPAAEDGRTEGTEESLSEMRRVAEGGHRASLPSRSPFSSQPRLVPCLLAAHSPVNHSWFSDRQVCSCLDPTCPPSETPLFL